MKGITLRAPLARVAIVLASALAMLATVAVVTGPADADEGPKKFTMSIDPGSVVAGEPKELTFTLTNTTSTGLIELGSANITIPLGLGVAIVACPNDGGPDDNFCKQAGETTETDFIQLRNLDLLPGSFLTWTFPVTAADCVPDTYEWVVVAKQANNFEGVGNELALEGSYPVTAVTCEEEEEEEDPDTTQGPQPGFTPPGGWDATVFCPGKQACPSPTVTLGNTSATLTSGGNAAALFLAVKDPDALPMACGEDFDYSQSGDVFFDVIGGQRHKTVAIRLIGANDGTDLADFEVCFGADSPWTQADGTPAVYDGSFFWVGLIDDCAADTPGNRPPGHADGLGQPIGCVLDRFEDGLDVVLVVLAPPGDPRIKIG